MYCYIRQPETFGPAGCYKAKQQPGRFGGCQSTKRGFLPSPFSLGPFHRAKFLTSFSAYFIPLFPSSREQRSIVYEAGMDVTGMNTQLLTQTLVESFNTLADEVQNLSDRQTILEHKLRYAHEQVCSLLVVS